MLMRGVADARHLREDPVRRLVDRHPSEHFDGEMVAQKAADLGQSVETAQEIRDREHMLTTCSAGAMPRSERPKVGAQRLDPLVAGPAPNDSATPVHLAEKHMDDGVLCRLRRAQPVGCDAKPPRQAFYLISSARRPYR